MDGEGLEQAIVWGYSFGARMAFATALYYPHRVTRVVMGGMHPYSVSNVHSAVRDRQSVIRQGMDAWVAHLDSRGIPLPEHRRRMLLANDHQALVAVDDSILSWQGFDDLDRFCGLNIPLLLYLGSRDRSYLPQAQQFASSCDQAQLVKLEGFNHFTALFDSDAVIAAIGSYLS
jgi:pimeloyl-ACP methyl ester carboxylesterase